MLLYLMRHGPAEDQTPGGRDADRRLTTAGRVVVERAAVELRNGRPQPLARILSSPLARALETAEIVCRIACLPSTSIDTADELSTQPCSRSLFELAQALGQSPSDCLLVGHNPDVEEAVRELVRKPPALRGFRTSMIVVLEKTEQAFEVRTIIDPHA